MMRRFVIGSVAVLLFFGWIYGQQSVAPSAGLPYHETRRITPADSILRLNHQFIIAHTERIVLDTTLLSGVSDYFLDTRHGILLLSASHIRSRFPLRDSTAILTIDYRALPFSFKDSYQARVPVVLTDSATGRSILVGKSSGGFTLDDILGSNLQKSGSIVRGFTVGSNRDLSLNSGLRIQMSGNLTPDLLLLAALTDENSPLQPEGTTRTLQEVDKVFVEVRGSKIGATLGDFNVDLGGDGFSRVQRKLQGGTGHVGFDIGDVSSRISVIGATPRGKYTTNQFEGLDGVQGPYELYGQNNEKDIVVIAGTERVYINGEKMTRGEVNDYIIDYSTAEITFSARRLISRISRITVDFEYSDRQFDRSFFGATSEQSILNNRISLRSAFYREADNENSPIDITLADSDKALLQHAGSDPTRASRSGVEVVGPGKGQYIAIDTLVKTPAGIDTLVTVYAFDPFDTLRAIYSVTFQFVGFGNGNYNKVAAVQYAFVGIRQGNYLPIRFLPLPTSQELADISLTGNVSEDLRVDGEFAHSSYNGNLFSLDPAVQSDGTATNLTATYKADDIRVGGSSLGGLEAKIHDRYIGREFRSLDRYNDVEYTRLWNITDSTAADEHDRDASLVYQPLSLVRGNFSVGEVKRGNLFTSTKSTAGLQILDAESFHGDYGIDLVNSDDGTHGMSENWIRQHGLVSSRLGKILPTLGYTGELLLAHSYRSDSLLGATYRVNEIRPGIRFDSLGAMTVQLGYSLRSEDSVANGVLRHAVTAYGENALWSLQGWSNLSSNLELTFLQKRFSEEFHPSTNDNNSFTARWQGRYEPNDQVISVDGYYEIATERTAKLERVFQQVPIGTGNYVYAGDVNGNHVVDDADFQQARFDGNFIALTLPSDQFIPDLGVKVSGRIRFNGFHLAMPSSWYSLLLSSLSSESYLRVEEKSTDPVQSDIYLLRLSHFLQDTTTLAGTQIYNQDLYLLENNARFSIRFRFNEARGLTQYDLEGERTYRREQSVRVRWQLIPEVSNQTDIAIQRDILTSVRTDPRLHNVVLTSLTMDWVYRPIQRAEIGMRFGTGRGSNYDSVRASLNDQSIRFVYSLNERGQGRFEFTREEVTLESIIQALPFELTGGKTLGVSWLWQLGFDYRLTTFLQASLTYDGRSVGGAPPIHTAKAEVRAFF